jgi:hypothetical protein
MSKNPKRQSLLRDFLAFLREEKLWWLLPLLLVLLLLGLLALGANSAGPLAPFIYPIF